MNWDFKTRLFCKIFHRGCFDVSETYHANDRSISAYQCIDCGKVYWWRDYRRVIEDFDNGR